MYQVIYTAKARKSLNHIDKKQAKMIIAWIEKNLVNCNDPRIYGKNMVNNFSEWRYRVGNYRILCNIHDEKITIEVINVGTRAQIYQKSP